MYEQICKFVFCLFQAIELASEVLANVKFIQEKKLIGEYINHNDQTQYNIISLHHIPIMHTHFMYMYLSQGDFGLSWRSCNVVKALIYSMLWLNCASWSFVAVSKFESTQKARVAPQVLPQATLALLFHGSSRHLRRDCSLIL